MEFNESLENLENKYNGYFEKCNDGSNEYIDFLTYLCLNFMDYIHIKTVLEFYGYYPYEMESFDDKLRLVFIKK